MNLHHYKWYLLLSSSFLLYAPDASLSPNITITVNPNVINKTYNNPTQTNSNTVSTQVEAINKPITLTYVHIKMPPQLYDYFDRYRRSVQQQYSSILQWLYTYRRLAIASSIIGFYTLLCYLVHKADVYVQNNECWFSWKRDFSLSELISLEQQQLSEQLLIAIQARYINASDPVNFLDPLSQFIQQIEYEQRILARYHTFIVWLDRFYMARLTWVRPGLINRLQEKLDRLAYLKKIFGLWLGAYNTQLLSHYQKPTDTIVQKIRHIIMQPLITFGIQSKRVIISLLT